MFANRSRWNLEPNELAIAFQSRQNSGSKLLDLTASNPTTVGLCYEEERILSSLADRKALVYEPDPRGLATAREAVIRYYAELKVPVQAQPDSVILTVSTSEAYSYAFRLLCNPGDEILVGEPSYPLFEYLAEIQDVTLVPYEQIYDHGWQIDFHSLRQKLTPRTRAIVLVNPNNPTGSYISAQEQSELNKIALERELALVVDEVFLDFGLDETDHTSFAANHDSLTFTLSGISKICALPQMKLSWLVTSGPQDLRREALARLEVIADTYLSPSAPVQHSACELLYTRGEIQRQLKARVGANLRELDRQLAGQRLCTRLALEGGWYAIVRVPATKPDEQLAVELLQQQSVLVHPGHFFNFHSQGYVVLSLITPEPDFSEGVNRLLAFIS